MKVFDVISGFILLIATVFTTACSATKILKESMIVTQDKSSTIMETTSLAVNEDTLGKTNNTTVSGIDNRTESSYVGNISDDWVDLEFVLNGVKFDMPFSYAQLRDDAGFSFDVNDYGYSGGYAMGVGDKVASTIYVSNSNYGESGFGVFTPSIGLKNYGDKVIDITECDVWAITADISHVRNSYPDLLLAKGVTWGASAEEVIATYGEPDEIYTPDSGEYDVFSWDADDETGAWCKMRLTVYHDERGLTMFDLKIYD